MKSSGRKQNVTMRARMSFPCVSEEKRKGFCLLAGMGREPARLAVRRIDVGA